MSIPYLSMSLSRASGSSSVWLGRLKVFRLAHSIVTGVAYTVTPRAATSLGKTLPSMNQRELAPYLKNAGSPVTGTGRRSEYLSSRYCQASCGSSTCESASTTSVPFISLPSRQSAPACPSDGSRPTSPTAAPPHAHHNLPHQGVKGRPLQALCAPAAPVVSCDAQHRDPTDSGCSRASGVEP